MKVRVVLAVLVALLAGAAGGWAVASSRDDEEPVVGPQTTEVRPLPASPSLPVEELRTDSDEPTLKPNIELLPQTLVTPRSGDGPAYAVTLPTPAGWGRRFDGVSKWGYTVDGTGGYPFGLRVQLIADQDLSIAEALRSRTAALESAEAQGNLADLELSLDPAGDGFEASYVADGFRTVSIERFYGGDESGDAFVTVAAYGRERDRVGLVDLLALVSRDLRTETREVSTR